VRADARARWKGIHKHHASPRRIFRKEARTRREDCDGRRVRSTTAHIVRYEGWSPARGRGPGERQHV